MGEDDQGTCGRVRLRVEILDPGNGNGGLLCRILGKRVFGTFGREPAAEFVGSAISTLAGMYAALVGRAAAISLFEHLADLLRAATRAAETDGPPAGTRPH